MLRARGPTARLGGDRGWLAEKDGDGADSDKVVVSIVCIVQ
jgi:hypothetical protein